MNDRSPRLFPHIVVRNLQPRTSEVSPTIGNHSSELQFAPTWVECDPDFDEDPLAHPLNCWTVLGIAIVIGTSGAFWAGVGLLINYLLK